MLVAAGLPAFIAEARFSGVAFRLFLWRSPETRMQLYLETVLAREDHAKEVKLFGLGPLFLDRYRAIFRKLYREDRDLTIRRDTWGFLLGLIATATLYGAYAWVALATIAARITLGQMTMYVMLFRQGQAAVSASLAAIGGMYEDNLYLATLYEYLETPVEKTAANDGARPEPEDGIRFENVSFAYPGAETPVLTRRESAHPAGRVARARRRERFGQDDADQAADPPVPADERADHARRAGPARVGRDCAASAHRRDIPGLRPLPALRRREHRRGRRAALRGRGALARGGRKRHGGADRSRDCRRATARRSASGSTRAANCPAANGRRSRCRAPSCVREADILVLDEPTAAMDAAAEAAIYEHFRTLTQGTDRDPDLAPFLDGADGRPDRRAAGRPHRRAREPRGRSCGQNGHYAHLFQLQAKGYR